MKKIPIYICFVLLFFSTSCYAQDMMAKDVMKSAFYREDGAERYSKAEMVLIDKKGNERTRVFELYSKDYGELMKTFLEFLEPSSIKGTKFLSIEEQNKDDTQYLYLPALGRARRIVSSQKKLDFVNTDYTYEDMQRRWPNEDEHSFLKDDRYLDRDCYVIESIPKDNNSQYSKRINWVDKKDYVILKTDFYGKRKKKTKEFRVLSLEKKQDIWTMMKTVMRDLKHEHSTVITIKEVKYNGLISDDLFTVYGLEE